MVNDYLVITRGNDMFRFEAVVYSGISYIGSSFFELMV